MSNKPHGTLYIGVTNNLIRRTIEHKHGQEPAFTARYRLHRLVYFEKHPTIYEAIRREKQLKRWRRKWKYALIRRRNPKWLDLFPLVCETTGLDTSLKLDHGFFKADVRLI